MGFGRGLLFCSFAASFAGCSLFLSESPSDDDGNDARVEVSPDQVNFGLVAVGQESGRASIDVRAFDDTPPLQASVDGVDRGFRVEGAECAVPLIAGQLCRLDVFFAPAAPGEATAELRIGNASVELKGEGLGPSGLSIDPLTHTFSGSAGALQMQDFTIASEETLSGLTIEVDGPDLSIQINGCASVLERDTNCLVTVAFDPPSPLPPTPATLTVTGQTDAQSIVAVASLSLEATPDMQTLMVTVQESGTVTSSPSGIDCDVNGQTGCTAMFAFDTVVTLTANPSRANNSFQGDCLASPCTVRMNQPRVVIVTIPGGGGM